MRSIKALKTIFQLIILFFFLGIPLVNAATDVTDNITENATWTLSGSPYHIKNSISVGNDTQDVTLTIEAGVQVIFRDLRGVADNRIDFIDGASLVVQGAADQKVLFTSEVTDKTQIGIYGGLRFHEDADAAGSAINHAVFEQGRDAVKIYTGTPLFQDCVFRYNEIGLFLETTQNTQTAINPLITGCAFEHHSNYGIHLIDSTARISSCRFENNGIWWDFHERWLPKEGAAIRLENSDPVLSGLSAPAWNMTNGVNQFVEIRNNYDRNLILELPGQLDGGEQFPYVVTASFSIGNQTSPVSLTIPEGVKIAFQDLRGISHCRIDIDDNASLSIQGTQDKPVLLTNVEPDKTVTGVWNGIRILETADGSGSHISHAVFEQTSTAIEIYNGTPVIESSVFRYGINGIWIETPDNYTGPTIKPAVTHCTFLHHDKFGVFISEADAAISSCRFENNGTWRDWNGKWVPDEGGAIGIDDSDPELSYNTCPAYDAVSGINQFVSIYDYFSRSATWKVPGTRDDGTPMPYFLWRTIYVENQDETVQLTIKEGVNVVFNDLRGVSHCRLTLGKNGVLIVSGTDEKPVLFTGVEPDKTQNSVWTGIWFYNDSFPESSKISGAVIEQAYEGIGIETGKLEVEQTIFRRSRQGIFIENSANMKITGSRFLNNQYGIYAKQPGNDVVVSGSVFQENETFGIYNEEDVCIDARNNYWGHGTGPLDDSDEADCVYRRGFTHHNPAAKGNKVSDHVIYAPWNKSETPCLCPDTDLDGVPDAWDECPDTPAGSFVNNRGCRTMVQWDIGDDGKQGLPEVMHILKAISNQ
ncbi:right-handed parallel beta-helix repeat-containing protein [Desulfobacter latus]|uniref:Right-handed parallel beta-helix repeat-containing protein n=1 Tax=Desulfobacter latus TaxID=2292 RepID=A0A850T130_9BACT|nr:right-handed parallel beta-helix repeat-containing protein [Desulfobacter latus]NWH05413.1 right-handed parallel beta-helix repeat-containing protein [Desulfobacter latus]